MILLYTLQALKNILDCVFFVRKTAVLIALTFEKAAMTDQEWVYGQDI